MQESETTEHPWVFTRIEKDGTKASIGGCKTQLEAKIILWLYLHLAPDVDIELWYLSCELGKWGKYRVHPKQSGDKNGK